MASRSRPEFDPPGLRAGSFQLRPDWEEGVGYDTNVFGSSSGRRGSWLVGSRPSLLIGSDWSRNSVGGYIGIDDLRYLDEPRQSRTDWTAALGGTLTVGRDQLTVAVAHFNQHQARTELDALPSDTPIAFRVEDVRVAYTTAFGRFSLTPSLNFSAYRYAATTIQGVPTSQSYRDRNVLQGAVTARYELTPQHKLLAVTRVLGSHYIAQQAGSPTRDSTGYQVLLGMEDDADAVWRYRLLLGWEVRDFHAPQYSTHQAPIAEAALIWSPTGLTTVTAKLTRGIEDASQEAIAGYTYTGVKLAVDHEYRRNWLLHATAGLQRADYVPSGGQATSFSVGGGVTWLINSNLRLGAVYTFTDQHSPASTSLQTTGNYTRSVGLLTLRAGM